MPDSAQSYGRQRLHVHTSDAGWNAAFASAAAGTGAALRHLPGSGGVPLRASGATALPDAIVASAAALSLGDDAAAGAVLESVATAVSAFGNLPGGAADRGGGRAPDGAAAWVIALAARHLAATGARGFATDLWPLLLRTAEVHPPAGPRHASSVRNALGAIAEAIGAPLPSALTVKPVAIGGAAAARPADEAARDAIDDLADASGSGDVGTADGDGDGAAAAGARVIRMLRGTFGAAPDAPRHRLELRPTPPADWTEIRADAFVAGDALVGFTYRRTETGAVFRLEQLAGAVPVQLVLQANVPLAMPLEFLLNGAPVELDAVSRGLRTLVPVQFPLDDDRVLEIRR